MAGDWLKFDKATPDKPEVFAIAGALSLDPDAVVGKLIRVWSWFDTHTVDGNGRGVTSPLLDRIAGVTGFVSAMASVGWVVVGVDGVGLPNFDRHNGKTAKERAVSNRRVAKHRNGNADVTPDVTLAPLQKPLPEKRREEKKEQKQNTAPIGADDDFFSDTPPQVVADFLAIRKAKKAPLTPTAIAGLRREAAKAGLALPDMLALCCERNWAAFKADWPGAMVSQSQPASVPGGGRRAL